jgi:nucleoside-diphosphate-sugar epimerase
MPNRILITGGAGFIGNHMAKTLSLSGRNELLLLDHRPLHRDNRQVRHIDNLDNFSKFLRVHMLDSSTLNDTVETLLCILQGIQK